MDLVAATLHVGPSLCRAAHSLEPGAKIRVFSPNPRCHPFGIASGAVPGGWDLLGHLSQGSLVKGPCLSCGRCPLAAMPENVQSLNAVIRSDGIRVDLLANSRKAVGDAVQSLRATGHAAHVIRIARRPALGRGAEVLVDLGILTARQMEVLEAAVAAGYFDTERQTSMRDLADLMGCSAGTVHEHLRKGLARLMEALFFTESAAHAPPPPRHRRKRADPRPAVAAR